MNNTELKKDWLAGSAVITFLAALMLAQTWRPTGGQYELPFNLTIPSLPDPLSFAIAACLFFSSFVLAVASMAPLRMLPQWFIPLVRKSSALLDLLVLFAFLQSWMSIASQLPYDQWWAHVLLWSGLAMLLFLIVRLFCAMPRLATWANRT